MVIKLKDIVFSNYKHIFRRCQPYYYKEVFNNLTTHYFNLQNILEYVLFYKSKPKILKQDAFKNEILFKEYDDKLIEYISLNGLYKLIIKRNNDYRICDLHIELGISKIKIIQGLKFICSINNEIEYTSQTIFTYIVYKYLNENHKVNIITEYDLQVIPYRCDIFIPVLEIIIEYYETWHKTTDYYDNSRKEHIEGLGYDIKVYKENSSIIKEFVHDLDRMIINKKLINEKESEDEYIINMLKLGGCDSYIAKNMYNFYKIGNEYKIELKECMLIMGYSDGEEDLAIKEIKEIVNSENYIEMDNKIYLNANGFKMWLLCSNSVFSTPYKQYYINLETICINMLKNTRAYLLQRNITMKNTASKLLSYAKENADKELIKQNKELKDKLIHLEKVNNELEEMYSDSQKKNLLAINVNKVIKEGDIFISQLPELIYTNDETAYVSVQNIKAHLEVNNMQLKNKDKISLNKALDIIKKRLNIENIIIYNNYFPHCKLIKKN